MMHLSITRKESNVTRRRIVLISGVLLLLFATNSVYSETYDIIDNYYSDSSMSTAVGWDERICGNSGPGDITSDGTITAYRDRTFWGCQSHVATVSCQVFDGTSFQTVDCPSTFNPNNRLRYPSWY
jgi:hypothetical protein